MAATLFAAGTAHARFVPTIEATSDYRVHGLSWSDGRPAIGAAIDAELPVGLHGGVWAVATRGAARHGSADAAIDLTLGRRTGIGALSLDTAVIAHAFPGGAGARDYTEGRMAIDGAIGPVSATLSADYAPRQQAIGGDLLHLRAAARIAVIGTSWTVRAQIGRTSGDTRNAIRAMRLRPDWVYLDWLLGADRVMGPLTVGIAYTDTDIGGGAQSSIRRHAGAVLLARAALDF